MVISIRTIGLTFFFAFGSIVTVSSQPTLQSAVSSNDILIGQQITLEVKADIPPEDYFVKWVEIPDSIQHFELVEKSKIDSVFTNQKLTRLAQKFVFTSFDSGKWTIPPFNVYFNPSTGGAPYNRFTDSFVINVAYQPDSSTVLRDIKDIRQVAPVSSLQFLLLVIAGGLVLLALLGWLIFYLLKKGKQKVAVAELQVSPYELATKELEKLRQMDLTQPEQVRSYHTRLKEILKIYLSSMKGPDFISSTTAEVLMVLNQKSFTRDALSRIGEALRRSDAARFAKYVPTAPENEQSWQDIKMAIDFTEQLQQRRQENGV